MTKAMKKAISDINKAINEREIDNFIDEFDDESNTYYFVKNCLTENQLTVLCQMLTTEHYHRALNS